MSFNPFSNPQDAATFLNVLANSKTADMASKQAQLSAEQLKQLQELQKKTKREQCGGPLKLDRAISYTTEIRTA